MEQRLFSKDFTLVVIGQIISLFGNAAIRFALPLYLLNLTGSSALYGMVTACAFIPSILLSPVGGIVADRVNKRNVMVILDFFTAVVILAFALLRNEANITVLLTASLMILYGIAPVLYVSIACFTLSAVMELFIKIPFQKQAFSGNIWSMVKHDFAQSVRFIRRERPVIGKTLLIVCGINLFLSAMIIVALPYLITEVLDFQKAQANRLYGFAQGALAAGGLAGGIGAGVFAGRLSIQKAGNLIVACAVCVFPMGAALILSSSGVIPDMASYGVMTICCFVIMVCSTTFAVQMMSFIQRETPQNLIGKVIAVVMTISMCAQPLGNALYGVLFGICQGFEYAVVLFSGAVSLAIAAGAGKVFKQHF